MKLIWYPSYLENDTESSVKVFIRKDLAKYHDLRLRVESFLKKMEVLQDLQPLFSSEQLAPVRNGLYEMRIPPQRRGGVVRIYYCTGLVEKSTLVLLDAEFKKETAPGRTETALKRMATYHESSKGRENDGTKRR